MPNPPTNLSVDDANATPAPAPPQNVTADGAASTPSADSYALERASFTFDGSSATGTGSLGSAVVRTRDGRTIGSITVEAASESRGSFAADERPVVSQVRVRLAGNDNRDRQAEETIVFSADGSRIGQPEATQVGVLLYRVILERGELAKSPYGLGFRADSISVRVDVEVRPPTARK